MFKYILNPGKDETLTLKKPEVAGFKRVFLIYTHINKALL